MMKVLGLIFLLMVGAVLFWLAWETFNATSAIGAGLAGFFLICCIAIIFGGE